MASWPTPGAITAAARRMIPPAASVARNRRTTRGTRRPGRAAAAPLSAEWRAPVSSTTTRRWVPDFSRSASVDR